MKNSKTKFTKRKSKNKLKRRWLGPGAAVTMPGGADNKCPICLEEFSQSEIDSNQTIQCNGCSQHFHENCIREWCESNITNRLCPICREPNICTNNDFNLDQPEPEPSQISDIITSLGLEHRRLQIINDTQIAEENTRFNALDSEDDNQRNDQMTIWVLDHLEEFINNINNSETNHDDEWVNETANNREENARIFREEVQRATFNRDLPVWFIAPRPEDSLDIQHLRDLYQLMVFTYNEYDRLKTEYPEYSYFELLFSSEKRNIHYKRAAAKRKLEDLQLRTFTYSMILIKKDTISRGLTVDPVDMVGDSSESESESESETGSQTQEDTPVPEPDDGEVTGPQEDTPVPEPVQLQVLEPQEEEALGALRRRAVAAQLREVAANRREVAANRRFAESQRQIADLERRRRQIAENIPQEVQDGGAGDLPDDRKELKEMCAKAGIPYSSKDGIARIKNRLRAPPTSPTRRRRGFMRRYPDRGATYTVFPKLLHKLLTNQEYSNIISWKNDNDGNVLIVLKDTLLVANELCPRANYEEAAMRGRFNDYGFNRISGRGDNEWVFSNPKVKSIDDILTLRALGACRACQGANSAHTCVKGRKQRIVNSPTIDDRDRDIANVLMQLNNQSPQSTDMAAMAVPRHVLLEHDEQGDLHSVGEESADMDNNEAANVLAGITNISDENTEDLDRRTSYLQNLNTNNEHSLKIALLIESLKNHVIDENEKNQIKQKQNELWQSLKEIELDNTKRKDILYKYMFEYLKRTIPQAKLNEGAKIAQSTFQSIQRAQIHNRPTEPLTESEQKQADEELNASISRGQQLAQDED